MKKWLFALIVVLLSAMVLSPSATKAWWHGSGGTTPPPPTGCQATLCVEVPTSIIQPSGISTTLVGVFVAVADNVVINGGAQSAISGISSLLSGVVLAQGIPPGTFTVTLSAASGGRFAVIGSGVTGNGTSTLTLTGSFTAVNALLAVTSFTGTANDTITANASDSFGNVSPTATLPVTVAAPVAPPASGVTTTLDPNNTSFCNTLDVTNLIFTNNGTNCQALGSYFSTRSFAAYSASKFYNEMTTVTLGTCPVNCDGTLMMGIGNSAANAELGQDANSIAGWNGTHNTGQPGGGGALFYGGAVVGTIPDWVAGDTIGIAVDLTAQLIWVRNNNAPTVWNAGGSANPATGVGGISFAGLSGPVFFYVSNNGWNGAQMVANFGATSYGQTAPSGFANWMGSGTGGGNPPPVFNPQATRNFDFMDKLSFVSHLNQGSGLTGAQTLADLQFVGGTHLREFGTDATLAAGGVSFDIILLTGSGACGQTASSLIASQFAAFDTFVGANPGAFWSFEGQNEPNNDPICWRNEPVTNGTTAAGNNTLHFATTPPAVVTVANNGFGTGIFALDRTFLDTVIDPGYQQNNATATSVPVTVTINASGEQMMSCINASGGAVTGITDTLGLTWTQRATTGGTVHMEEWTATGPVGGSYPQTDVVTITQTSSAAIDASVWGVQGSTNAFDASPVTATSDPVTISTTHANTAIFGCFHATTNNLPAPGATWTTIASGYSQQYGSALYWGFNNNLVEFNLFTSNQTNLTVNCGVGTNNNVGTCAGHANAVIADALIMSSARLQPIPPGTTVSSATGTTVVLSANAVGAGVGSGDDIHITSNMFANSAPAALLWQVDTYNAAHGDSNFTGVPVLNTTNFPSVGIAGTADYNNQHFYPAGQPAASYFPVLTIPGLPVAVTETGFQLNVFSTAAQAHYLLNDWFDVYVSGGREFTIYDLIDSLGETYGVYTAMPANAAKPSATALHNLTTILNDAGGTKRTFSPGTLSYSIDGLPPKYLPVNSAGGNSFLLQRSDGRWYIVIWNEPNIFNASSKTDIVPPPTPLLVHFGASMTTANVYDPITGTSPITTVSGASTLNTIIGADPLIVELIP